MFLTFSVVSQKRIEMETGETRKMGPSGGKSGFLGGFEVCVIT